MGFDINYSRFDPRVNPELVAAVVDCYREIFAAEPWNEWMKCPACQKVWGRSQSAELIASGYRHCEVDLVEFWTRDQVRSDLHHEITTNASCWIATEGDRVVGFCWGYPITPERLAEKLELPKLGEEIRAVFGAVELLAYQDEIGVVKELRGKKIAKEMSRLRLQDFRDRGLNIGIARTKTDPPSVTYLWYERDGYKVISRYPSEGDSRVVQAGNYSDLRTHS